MKYIYLLILCTLLALIVSFRNYKKEQFSLFFKKAPPLMPLYGLSMVFIDLSSKFIKADMSEKAIVAKLKAISLGISSFTILIFFGLLYSFTSNSTASSHGITEGSLVYSEEISSIIDNESNMLEMETETKLYEHIASSIELFEKYREDIENAFLGENVDFLTINKPLNLITEYGEEPIIISWSFEIQNVIDKNGNILYDNVASDGCANVAYASLTHGDTTATLTIPIYISPP